MDARHLLGVCGVIRDAGGRVLLIRTAQAGWELPGGRVEAGEDLRAALVREAREETGCLVLPGRLVSLSHRFQPPLLLLTFLCAYESGTPRPGDDTLETGWFSPAEALRLVTHPTEHLRLLDGLEPPAETVVRVTP